MNRIGLACLCVWMGVGCATTTSVAEADGLLALKSRSMDDMGSLRIGLVPSFTSGAPATVRAASFAPAQIRVTLHNGLDHAVRVHLACGATSEGGSEDGSERTTSDTTVDVQPLEDRYLYFFVARKVQNQAFGCDMTDWNFLTDDTYAAGTTVRDGDTTVVVTRE